MTNVANRIKGSITALITPFKDGKVDEAAFRKLVNWQIEQGTHGLVPCGTTGESPTLSHDEHRRVIDRSHDRPGQTIRAGSGNLHSLDKWNFCLTSA